MQISILRPLALVALATSLAVHAAPSKEAAESGLRSLPWQKGPITGSISGKGTLNVPAGSAMLDQQNSSKFMQYTGNLPSNQYNVVVGDDWWAAFSFHDVGYVKDDEAIDADALLKQMKDSDGPANEERRKQGLGELYTDGWFVPPHYDSKTKRLEWGMRLRSPGQAEPTINYTVRLLGRTGYEAATLVSSPDHLQRDVVSFKEMLDRFDFNPGEKYSEFKQGDRVAEFGLAALVAGGAAAVAAKTGFWKVLLGGLAAFWKVIAAAAVAVLASIGKLFKRQPKSS